MVIWRMAIVFLLSPAVRTRQNQITADDATRSSLAGFAQERQTFCVGRMRLSFSVDADIEGSDVRIVCKVPERLLGWHSRDAVKSIHDIIIQSPRIPKRPEHLQILRRIQFRPHVRQIFARRWLKIYIPEFIKIIPVIRARMLQL